MFLAEQCLSAKLGPAALLQGGCVEAVCPVSVPALQGQPCQPPLSCTMYLFLLVSVLASLDHSVRELFLPICHRFFFFLIQALF